jgi:hypothetical protein
MKKIILILISILFASNVNAHSTKGHTPNLDYSAQCTKKKSVLNFIAKHKLYRANKGEIIKFNSYTAFDVQNVISGAYNSSGNGNIANGEPNVKFRFALSAPFTMPVGRLPTLEIAFDLSAGINFSSNCTSSVTPGPPVVEATFK